jgi:pyrroline-5-carboxylate reductase
MFTGKVGFIGCGNMGSAIMEGIIAKRAIHEGDVYAYDAYEPALKKAAGLGVNIVSGNIELAKSVDMVILAVKPKDALAALDEIKSAIETKALLSIVAGLNYETIHKILSTKTNKSGARVLITMPNTPIIVGSGATGFTLETTFTGEEKLFAQKLFEAVGIVEWLPEKLMSAATALSGGGPAYSALFLEAMADGGVLEGLSRQTAYRLAAQTLNGTAKLLLEKGLHPGELKDAVCSPAGTTIEGIKALEKGAFRHCIIEAIHEASKKMDKLGSVDTNLTK